MREEINFLKELQTELKTQETDYQAAPRFWAIMDYRVEPTHEDYAERMMYFFNNGDHVEFSNHQELVEFLDDNFYGKWRDEAPEELLADLEFETLWEWVVEEYNPNNYFQEVPVKEEGFVVQSTFFFTKSEAKRHLELNHYHYTKKAHTYAMTAWRAPKVERLLEILETFDWDKVRIAEVAQ